VLHYCRALEAAGKYQLWLWPPHCLLGGEGHALAGVVQEARLFHAYCRTAQSRAEIKGEHALSENYSVLGPEVLTDQHGAQVLHKNDALISRLLSADRLVIAGQASSHCVKSTVEDLLEAILARDPKLARKVFLLTDCMSAVTVPDGKGGLAADFTQQADAALARFAEAGMRLLRSDTPVGELSL
jgi:nicotinamidase-related amidase